MENSDFQTLAGLGAVPILLFVVYKLWAAYQKMVESRINDLKADMIEEIRLMTKVITNDIEDLREDAEIQRSERNEPKD